MSKRGSPPGKTTRSGTAIIGRERFAKISAVEGIELPPEMKRRAAEFDRKKLSREQRIRAIVAAHREG